MCKPAKNVCMQIEKALRRKINRLILISLLSFLAALILHYSSGKIHDRGLTTERNIREILNHKEQELQKAINTALSDQYYSQPFEFIYPALKNELETDEGLFIFIYRNDSLIFWSDNSVPADPALRNELSSKPFIRYGNGWFRVIRAVKNNMEAIGLILIKRDYPYQNEYLVNDFQKDFGLEAGIRLDTVPGTSNIMTQDGQFLFSVSMEPGLKINPAVSFSVFGLLVLFFISTVILLFYLYHLFDFFRREPLLLFIAFCLDAILFRALILVFKIPGFLYHTDLFSPYYFATSFISPSLGDLVVNSLLWLTLAWIFFEKVTFSRIISRARSRVIYAVATATVTGILFYLLISTLRRLVMDSNIELNLNNIFSIDVFSGMGFLAMTSLIMAFFLLTSRLCLLACSSGIKLSTNLLISFLISLALIPLFYNQQFPVHSLIYPLLLFIYFLALLNFSQRSGGFRNITGALVFIVLFSIIATYVLDFYHEIKEKEYRKILATALSSKRDPLMEYEFGRLKPQMIKDSNVNHLILKQVFDEDNDAQFISYINEKYFTGFRNNYEVLITVCRKDEVLSIQPGGYLQNCYEYFEEQISKPNVKEISSGLYFLNENMENCNYLATIDLSVSKNAVTDSVSLFIELFYKYASETSLGYPDLLIDKKVKMISGLENYSYAKYVDEKLIYKNGDFSYPLALGPFAVKAQKGDYIDYEGYNHYILGSGTSNTLIISKKNLTFLDLIAPFSYLFIIFSIFLLVFLIGYIISGGFSRLEFNFSNRLQISIIAIILISFMILGMITRANIIHLYNNKNRDNLSEKTFSVLTEIEHKLGQANVITEDLKPYIEEILYKFSLIFYSDINLFDAGGTLIASSRPQIFSEGLISDRMNTNAYYNLAVGQRLLYIQNEKIGKQEYLSAYVPFRNNNDEIIAYVNLPYFAKQTELRKEIGDFLAAYINVYVLLIVLAVMVTILVSRFMTRPLILIREKLRKIGVGKSNEKIDLKRKDEIGNLVEEYNRMIDELARSAELLARSERESAWREMAKQVAHEIKNPLTPMKLSVQYLQKAWDEKSPDWENHLSRFSRTIVEQIDSLSEIASEFSDFAKMPAANIEKTDLSEIIKSASELYSHHRHITLTIEQSEAACYVSADKKQLLRVFNNLIQNAVQAIGKKSGGQIRIKIDRDGEHYIIGVSDNGSGIKEEEAGRIFSPSFTTKSSGMGLGLAMSKSILNTIGATISFESKSGEGTTFTIKIPVNK